MRGGRWKVLSSLGRLRYGEGDMLQDAADDLIARLLTTAMRLRSGFTSSTEVRPPDLCWLDFVYRLGEIATEPN